MKKFKTLLIAAAFLTSIAGSAFAKTEYVSSGRRPQRRPAPSRSYHSYGTDLGEELANLLVGTLWLLNNGLVSFEQYPYATDGKYLHFDGLAADATSETVTSGTRVCRFSVSAAPFYMFNYGSGVYTEFEGYFFKMFGPYFENTIYGKTYNAEQPAASLLYASNGNFRLGAQFALFQFNPLSMSMYTQWSHWYGIQDTLSLSGSDGLALGFNLRSYPVKPLVIEWRFGVDMILSGSSTEAHFNESDLKIGIMTGPVELFGSWKYRAYYENDRLVKNGNGASLGMQIYF